MALKRFFSTQREIKNAAFKCCRTFFSPVCVKRLAFLITLNAAQCTPWACAVEYGSTERLFNFTSEAVVINVQLFYSCFIGETSTKCVLMNFNVGCVSKRAELLCIIQARGKDCYRLIKMRMLEIVLCHLRHFTVNNGLIMLLRFPIINYLIVSFNCVHKMGHVVLQQL